MDVFVIPVARERYELYCEPVSEAEAEESAAGSLLGRWRQRLNAMLRSAEQKHHRRGEAPADERGLIGRTQDRMMAWVVERIAEQRLLWNLRGQTAAQAIHPEDMTTEQVLALVRRSLQHDYDRHLRWMIVDGIAFLLTFILLGPFFLLLPGVANLPALYFGFRVVGHWFSMVGARQGIRHVTWTAAPCASLTELREVVEMEPAAREQRVHAIANRLRLQHLSTFFERVAAVPGS